MKNSLTLVLVATIGLSGCGAFSGTSSPFSGLFGGKGLRGSQQEIDGIRFGARSSALTDDKRGFAITVRGADRALPQALEAGRTEGIAYCLDTFGGSEITWAQGPDREIEEVALADGGDLVLTGTCIAR